MLLHVVHWLFHEWWLLKESFVSSRVYRRVLLSKSSFKRLIFTLFDQLNTNLQGISIPPHSCLQWRLRPVTSTHIFPPRAIKYHKVCKYSQGKWPTIRCFLPVSQQICQLHSEVFLLLWVSKQLYRHGIPEELSRKYNVHFSMPRGRLSSVPDSSPHLKLG